MSESNGSTNGGILRELSVQVAELKGAIKVLQATLNGLSERIIKVESEQEGLRDKIDAIWQLLAKHQTIISIVSAVLTAIAVSLAVKYFGG